MIRIAKENQGLETTFLDSRMPMKGKSMMLSVTIPRYVSSASISIDPSQFLCPQLIWIESPTNPTLRLIDIPRIVATAKAHSSHPLVLVDNTFMSPFYSSPLLQGVDIVLHSLTKYINDHTDVVMGAVILPQHHTALYDRLAFLQDAIGAVQSAFDCWLAQRGAKTLHLRMKEHSHER